MPKPQKIIYITRSAGCPNCNALAKLQSVERLGKAQKLPIEKVYADENPHVANIYGCMSVPFVLVEMSDKTYRYIVSGDVPDYKELNKRFASI